MKLTEDQARYAKHINFETGKVSGDIRGHTEALKKSPSKGRPISRRLLGYAAIPITGMALWLGYHGLNVLEQKLDGVPAGFKSDKSIEQVLRSQHEVKQIKEKVTIKKGVHIREEPTTDSAISHSFVFSDQEINGVSTKGADSITIYNVIEVGAIGFDRTTSGDWIKIVHKDNITQTNKFGYISDSEETREFVDDYGNEAIKVQPSENGSIKTEASEKIIGPDEINVTVPNFTSAPK